MIDHDSRAIDAAAANVARRDAAVRDAAVLDVAVLDVAVLDVGMLRERGRDLSAPFQLRLLIDGRVLEARCEQVLRLLPGKRLVAKARIADEPVLLKIFFDRRHGIHANRERRGLSLLSDAGFTTPEVLMQGQLAAARSLGADEATVLVLRFVDHAMPLSQFWRTADIAARNGVLAHLVNHLAALHAAGAWQDDVHFDNFLHDGQLIYAVDGGGVQREPRGTARMVVDDDELVGLDNLALLHAQLHLDDDACAELSLPLYVAARGWPVDAGRHARFLLAIAAHRARRMRRYLVKVFRDCTEFQVTKSARAFTVWERALEDELKGILSDPDLAIAAGEVLKAGRTATVARVRGRQQSWVIKRYNRKGALHTLGHAARRTRAELSWRNAQRLKLLGLPTAHPVALHVETLGPLRGRSYFIMAEVPGMPLDRKVGIEWQPDEPARVALTKIFAGLLSQRLVHGDLKASNFMVTNTGVQLIDLDGMREVPNRDLFNELFAKDLARFRANWLAWPALTAWFEQVLPRVDCGACIDCGASNSDERSKPGTYSSGES